VAGGFLLTPLAKCPVNGLHAMAVSSKAIYSQGSHTFAVDRNMHAENRQKVLEEMKKLGARDEGLVIVQGGVDLCRADTDHEPLFRQVGCFTMRHAAVISQRNLRALLG
jgi:hypothetical protein